MGALFDRIAEWLKTILMDGIIWNLSSMFDLVNQSVENVATQVGTTPANFSPGVFSLIRGISESVILPIAGIILTFICCWELVQMLIEHNNMANFDASLIFKWIFKTFIAVTLVSNTFNITMVIRRCIPLIRMNQVLPSRNLAEVEKKLKQNRLHLLLLPDTA